MLLLQATPFCNIACDYCYLPHRNDRGRMAPSTAGEAVAWLYREGLAADPLSVVWHAGEPLAVPPRWYEAAFAAIRAAAPPGARLLHGMQTNATLINEAWCDFFLRHDVRVGVSLDGPAWLHDRCRITRTGGGTHAAAMRGVALLRRHGIPFHAICVVTRATLEAPDALTEFFLGLGVEELCLNVEEAEGVHQRSSLPPSAEGRALFARFLDRIAARAEEAGLRLREADGLLDLLRDPGFGRRRGNDQTTPFEIVTVTRDGRIGTFSPELAGLAHPVHGDFLLGDVRESTLSGILRSARFRLLWREIATGVAACAAACPYFRLCGGGAPANKLAEHGSLAGTETLSCALSVQTVAEVVLRRLEARLAAPLSTRSPGTLR